MEKEKDNISKVSTESSFIDDLKKYFPPDLFEKYTQPGVLEKICKAYFDIEMPRVEGSRKRMHKPEYQIWCEVCAVLANRHEELIASQPVNVGKLLKDKEILEAADCSEYGSKRSARDNIKKYCKIYGIECLTQEQALERSSKRKGSTKEKK